MPRNEKNKKEKGEKVSMTDLGFFYIYAFIFSGLLKSTSLFFFDQKSDVLFNQFRVWHTLSKIFRKEKIQNIFSSFHHHLIFSFHLIAVKIYEKSLWRPTRRWISHRSKKETLSTEPNARNALLLTFFLLSRIILRQNGRTVEVSVYAGYWGKIEK